MAITCTIDAKGLTVPALADIRAYFVSAYRGIYGSDVYLESDSQDGQLLDLFAAAINDANAMTASVYNAFSPVTAQGNGLSRVVKINGISRHSASYSTVDLLIGGTAGTVITNGVAVDGAGVSWALPSTVTIPSTGQVTVTATCATIGDISAAAGTIVTIGTPTRGWQTVANPLAAAEGNPVETDAELRIRQRASTAIPSQTIFAGLIGAVAAIPGVTTYGGVDNDSSAPTADGVPAHAVSVVVGGGDAQAIAEIIFAKKGPGVPTWGTTSETVVDMAGVPHTVSFMRPTEVPIAVYVTLSALTGYTSNIGAKIKAAVASYINGLDLGAKVYIGRIYGPANLTGTSDEETFDITLITVSRDGHSPSASNIALAFHEIASCTVDDVALVVS